MSYKVRFTKKAEKEYNAWKTADRRIFDRLNELIAEIKADPFAGSGNPEALKHELTGKWSRHLTQRDRIVYELVNDEIWVYQCRYHY